MVDIVVKIDWSRHTVMRDIEVINKKMESLLKNTDMEELTI